VKNLNYASFNTVLYQKLTVSITDILFIVICMYSILQYRTISSSRSFASKVTIILLSILNVGLFFVDHIHFQYNGVLFGLLFITLHGIYQDNLFLTALAFSLLVCMKHLFVLFAPLVGIYLLMKVIASFMQERATTGLTTAILHAFRDIVLILLPIVTILLTVFGPFVYISYKMHGVFTIQLEQLIKRLFPFGRGLIHAYWAPNCWALYCFLDKTLSILLPRYYGYQLSSLKESQAAAFSSTSGLVGEYHFYILPKITATHCLLIVVMIMIPILFIVSVTTLLAFVKKKVIFLRAFIFLSMTTFMLGYHVHEKAILIPWVLQGVLTDASHLDALIYLLLSAMGTVSLFPLIPGHAEWIIKGT